MNIQFLKNITNHTLIHEDMRVFLEAYPTKAHPMGILAASLSTISTSILNLKILIDLRKQSI